MLYALANVFLCRKQRREKIKFKVGQLWRTCAHDGEVFILYLNSIAVPTNLVPLKVRPNSVQDERAGIIAKFGSKTISLYVSPTFSLAFPSSVFTCKLIKLSGTFVRLLAHFQAKQF